MSKNTNLSFLTDYITADITNGRIGINNASPSYAFDITGVARTSTSTYLATASGSVGIGTTSPDALLTVAGANQATGAAFNTYGNVLIYSTDSFAINKGGALSLGGKYNSAGTPIATFARIHGKKENATVDSTSGYLSFETTPEATAILTERMRIKSDGQVIIGDTSMLYTNADGHPFGVKSTSSQCFISLAYAGQTLASGGLSVGITGVAAYYFVRDYVPIIFATGNNERMRMLANGNLSLGTTSDVSAKIYIVSSTASYGIVYQNASVNNFYVGVGGDGYLKASAWSYGSDIRMKENISDVSNGLDLITKLKPKHFDYIDGIKNNLGFIAQDVQELIPQAVSISDKKTGMLALKTDFIIPYLVKAIQELSAEITILKNK